MLFYFLTLILASSLLVDCKQTSLNDQFQTFLNSLPDEKIPEKFKIKTKDDNTHWCCKIDVPPTQFQQTRVITSQVINSERYKCG